MNVNQETISFILSIISLGSVIGTIFSFKTKTETVQKYTDEKINNLEEKIIVNTAKLDEKINNSLLRIEKTLDTKLDMVNKILDIQNNKIHEFDKVSSIVTNNMEILNSRLEAIDKSNKENLKYLHDIDLKLNSLNIDK